MLLLEEISPAWKIGEMKICLSIKLKVNDSLTAPKPSWGRQFGGDMLLLS